MSDDLTMIECLLAGRKMKLQDISSIKWKETKVAHPGVFTERGEAMKRDYDLASTFDQEDLSLYRV